MSFAGDVAMEILDLLHAQSRIWSAAKIIKAKSGVEGACRHVIKDRMERSGMRWKEKGACSMLNLRCIEASEFWDVTTQQHRDVNLSKYGKERRNYCEAFLTMAS